MIPMIRSITSTLNQVSFVILAAAILSVVSTVARGQTIELDPAATLNNAWGPEWNTAANFESWTTSGVTGGTVSGGLFSGTSSSTAPQITRTGISGGPDLDLAYNDYLDIRLQVPATFTGDIKINYGVTSAGVTASKTGFAADRIVTIPNATIAKDGALHTYRVDMSLVPWWRGTLSDLRLDIGTASGVAFALDFVRVGDTGVVPTVTGTDPACERTLESKHFIFGWSDVPGTLSAGKVDVTRARSNLRDLEECWAIYVNKLNYNKPRWNEAGGPYKVVVTCIYGGYYGGGGGLNIDPSGLSTDPNPPSWIIPHEFAHVCQSYLNPNGAVPGEYWEMHANYSRERWLENMQHLWPGTTNFQPGILSEMHMNLPIGRNYYEAWPFYLYLDANPDGLSDLGDGTVADVWKQMASGENIYETLKRIRTTPVKDMIGYYARRGLTYNYPNNPNIRLHIGGIQEWAQLTEPVRRPDDANWWQVPADRAPMQTGFAITELVPSGSGAGRVVSVDLRGLLVGGGADWRGSLIVIDDSGNERYSPLFGNNATGSVTLAATENRVYLSVAATPDSYQLYRFDEPAHPYRSDSAKRRFHYEFKVSGASPKVRGNGSSAGLVQHANGGGYKAGTATVASTAFIGANARVLGSAQVLGNARVEDFAVVSDSATLKDTAIARGHATVSGSAVVSGSAIVADFGRISANASMSGTTRLLEHGNVTDNSSITDQSVVKGASVVFGGSVFSGNAIADGDYSFARDIKNASIFGHLPWVGIPDNWLVPLPASLFACYEFNAASEVVAHDTYAVTDGLLRGSPGWTASDSGRSGILTLNGTSQWVQLERAVTEMTAMSVSAWVKWDGGAANQALFQFGDGSSKYITFTPSNGSGVAELKASNGTNTYSIAASAPLPVGVWSRVAASLDGTTGSLSVNGGTIASGSLPLRPDQVLPPNIATSPAHHFIGRSTSGNFFAGSLDDFKVYSSAAPSFTLVTAEALPASVPENSDSAKFRFTRTSLVGSSTSGALTIDYTVGGTATPGADYTALSGSAVIPDGQSYVDVSLNLITDTLTENDETVTVTLSPSANYSGSGGGSATVTIHDVGSLPSALLARYLLDDASGSTAADSSGNNNHGTVNGGAVWNNTERALAFDGSDDYVETPVGNGTARTLSAWIRPNNAAAGSSDANVFSTHIGGQFGTGWGVRNGQIFVVLDDTAYDSGVAISSHVWQHVSLTFSITEARLYVNGQFRHTQSYSQGDVAQANYRIGHTTNGDFSWVYFDGDIRDARIYNREIFSTEANTIYQDVFLQAPRNLTAIAGNSSVALSWTPSDSGALTYIVRRATTAGGPYVPVASNLTATTYNDAGAANGTTYYYVVQAGAGPYSNEVSATPAGTSVPPPWLQANIGTAAGSPTTTYAAGQFTVNGAGSTIGGGTTSDNFRILYLPVVGDCTITARLQSLTGTPDIRAGVTLRESTATGVAHATAMLNQTTTTTRGVFIYRSSSTSPNNSSVATIVNTPPSRPWFRVTRSGNSFSADYSTDGTNWISFGSSQTLSMSTSGPYLAGLVVCSRNTSALAAATFTNVTITSGYPINLTATAGDAQVKLDWAAVGGATSYKVKRATTNGGPYTTLTPNPTTNTFIDTTTANGTTYHYVVSAVKGTAESANSAQVSATPAAPLPGIVQNLTATSGQNQIELFWNATANASSYIVKRGTTSLGPFTQIDTTTSPGYTDTTTVNGTTYHYVVLASNSGGVGASSASVSASSFGDGIWTSTSNGDWSMAGNWQAGGVAFGADKTATFSQAADVTVNQNISGLTLGALAFSNANTTLNGNAFTLATNSGTPTISVGTGVTATFASSLGGSGGLAVTGPGILSLTSAPAYSGATSISGATLSNGAVAGTSFSLNALALNGATLAAANAGAASLGNFQLRSDVTVGGTAQSVISADVRVIQSETRTFNVGATGDPSGTDLLISGRLGHQNNVAWGYAVKAGAGTMKISGANEIGSMTVNSGNLILQDTGIGGMWNGSLTNNAQAELCVTAGTASYTDRTIYGNGTYSKTGPGVLNLLSFSNSPTVVVENGRLHMTGGHNNFWAVTTATVRSGAVLSNNTHSHLKGLILDGGELTSTGTDATWGSWMLDQTVTVTGSGTSVISAQRVAIANASNVSRIFDVAASATLNLTGTFENAATTTANGLTKTGAGKMVLSGTNTYNGATIVNGGTLAVNSSLPASSAVSIGGASATGMPTLTGSGAVNGSVTIHASSGGSAGTLNPGDIGTTGQLATGSATINGIIAIDLNAGSADKLAVAGNLSIAAATLSFNPISAPTAISYDLASYTGSLDATAFAAVNNLPSGYQLQFDAANKLIKLVQSLSAFDTWATTTHGLSGAAAAFDADPDNDGLANGLEWILGGNPSMSSASIAPSATLDASNNFVITFNRLEASITEATLKLEYGSDLTTWPGQIPIGATSAGPDANGISVSINTVPSPDAVTVTIPAANAANGHIFTRLRAMVVP